MAARSPSDNPLITITWPDSGFTSATSYVTSMWLEWTDDATVTTLPVRVNDNAGAPNKAGGNCQYIARFTPVNAKKYRFAWINVGD